jgi:drug/metabolite transporter (DMT)-like permease
LGAVAVVGLLDGAAGICIAYALSRGNLGVVAVLGAQFPVVTVLLARAILGEQLKGNQGLGVLLALVGIGLLAAGWDFPNDAAWRWTVKGTQRQKMFGVEPDDREITLDRDQPGPAGLRRGREHWGFPDVDGFYRQFEG